MPNPGRFPAALALAMVIFAAFGAPARADRLKVVATFSILGDLTARVGGGAIDLTVLVGPDGDAHTYEPTPDDQRAVAAAAVLIANGLGFEPWLGRLEEAAGFQGVAVAATAGIVPLTAPGQAYPDPHAFQDLANGAVYVANILQALTAADPAHAAQYRENARRFTGEILDLHREIAGEIAAVPPANRRILTSHDAFQYFARAYGIQFLAIQGVNTESEPSAADLGRLSDQVKRLGVKAIFLENMSNPALARTISGETGVPVGGELYADALSGPDGPAADYLALFRSNVATLLTQLR